MTHHHHKSTSSLTHPHLPSHFNNHAIIAGKCLSLIINIVVCALYRVGSKGSFLGASYNKSYDAESLTQGVFIGFLIFNIAILISLLTKKKSHYSSILEIIMDLIGGSLWFVAGSVIVTFWLRLELQGKTFQAHIPTFNIPVGLTMGALAMLNSFVYFIEAFMGYKNFKYGSKYSLIN